MGPWLVRLFVCTAILGTVGVTRKRRWGMALWFVSDLALLYHNAVVGEWEQAALWCVYTFLAAWGWVTWGRDVPR